MTAHATHQEAADMDKKSKSVTTLLRLGKILNFTWRRVTQARNRTTVNIVGNPDAAGEGTRSVAAETRIAHRRLFGWDGRPPAEQKGSRYTGCRRRRCATRLLATAPTTPAG